MTHWTDRSGQTVKADWKGRGKGPWVQGTVIDPRTGRPVGDHGTAAQAIEWALDQNDDYAGVDCFLRAWREGDLGEWPEFYEWLTRVESVK